MQSWFVIIEHQINRWVHHMTKAAIAGLSEEERKIFINDVKEAFAGNVQQNILIEALEILDRLLSYLGQEKTTITQLRELFGIELAKLKKHQEKS
jgi:hypothetical protein